MIVGLIGRMACVIARPARAPRRCAARRAAGAPRRSRRPRLPPAAPPPAGPLRRRRFRPDLGGHASARRGRRGASPRRRLIAGYGVTGQLVDPADQIQALLESVAPIGSPFIESGPADRIGTPIGTIPRLTQSLDSIGYARRGATDPPGGRVA